MFSTKLIAIISTKFPGGTSSAFISEIPVLKKWGLEKVFSPTVKMTRKLPEHPALIDALAENDIHVMDDEDVPTIAAENIVIHNPAMFKFETALNFKMFAKNVFIVMHENPVDAFGTPQYAYQTVMDMLVSKTICENFYITPISDVSRKLISRSKMKGKIHSKNWNNIIHFLPKAPSVSPQDTRGRLSRPGMEKWCSDTELRQCFPAHSVSNHILGADLLIDRAVSFGKNTSLIRFGGTSVDTFLKNFDFFVYFHSAAWRESFGRVIAEAIAAGKLVITHPYLKQTFGSSCVYGTPSEVDQIIRKFVQKPNLYTKYVKAAQNNMSLYGVTKFEEKWLPELGRP